MEFPQPNFTLDTRGNGIDTTPPKPGVYAIMNIVNRRCYVGCAENLRSRCQGHMSLLKKGTSNNGVLRRDIEILGVKAFVFIAIQIFDSVDAPGFGIAETDWIYRLQSHIEGRGYNGMVGNQWTKGAALRDRERKLIRRRSYFLLDGVNIYDPINEKILETWERTRRYLY